MTIPVEASEGVDVAVSSEVPASRVVSDDTFEEDISA